MSINSRDKLLSDPNLGVFSRCKNCGKDIMWAKYNGVARWCHVPLLRVRCSESIAEPEPEGRCSECGHYPNTTFCPGGCGCGCHLPFVQPQKFEIVSWNP